MMKLLRVFVFLSLFPSALSATSNCVVNLSHYDSMRVNFSLMKDQGIIGVIHEATYPRFEQDVQYRARQIAATRAGLVWGAYHFGDATDPIRQADHFLRVVSSSWAGTGPEAPSPGVLLVLDFEKNGHYPGGTMRPDQAVAFVERIRERTGKYPGVYGSENRLRAVLNAPNVSACSAPRSGKLLALGCQLPLGTALHCAMELLAPCGSTPATESATCVPAPPIRKPLPISQGRNEISFVAALSPPSPSGVKSLAAGHDRGRFDGLLEV